MSKFKVTYPNGLIEEIEQSDCDSLAAFVNCKFGSSDYESVGITVEQVEESSVAAEAADKKLGKKAKKVEEVVVNTEVQESQDAN